MGKISNKDLIELVSQVMPKEDKELCNEILREYQKVVDKYAETLHGFSVLLLATSILNDALDSHRRAFLQSIKEEKSDEAGKPVGFTVPISMN
jgi:hypothetical protein